MPDLGENWWKYLVGGLGGLALGWGASALMGGGMIGTILMLGLAIGGAFMAPGLLKQFGVGEPSTHAAKFGPTPVPGLDGPDKPKEQLVEFDGKEMDPRLAGGKLVMRVQATDDKKYLDIKELTITTRDGKKAIVKPTTPVRIEIKDGKVDYKLAFGKVMVAVAKEAMASVEKANVIAQIPVKELGDELFAQPIPDPAKAKEALKTLVAKLPESTEKEKLKNMLEKNTFIQDGKLDSEFGETLMNSIKTELGVTDKDVLLLTMHDGHMYAAVGEKNGAKIKLKSGISMDYEMQDMKIGKTADDQLIEIDAGKDRLSKGSENAKAVAVLAEAVKKIATVPLDKWEPKRSATPTPEVKPDVKEVKTPETKPPLKIPFDPKMGTAEIKGSEIEPAARAFTIKFTGEIKDDRFKTTKVQMIRGDEIIDVSFNEPIPVSGDNLLLSDAQRQSLKKSMEHAITANLAAVSIKERGGINDTNAITEHWRFMLSHARKAGSTSLSAWQADAAACAIGKQYTDPEFCKKSPQDAAKTLMALPFLKDSLIDPTQRQNLQEVLEHSHQATAQLLQRKEVTLPSPGKDMPLFAVNKIEVMNPDKEINDREYIIKVSGKDETGKTAEYYLKGKVHNKLDSGNNTAIEITGVKIKNGTPDTEWLPLKSQWWNVTAQSYDGPFIKDGHFSLNVDEVPDVAKAINNAVNSARQQAKDSGKDLALSDVKKDDMSVALAQFHQQQKSGSLLARSDNKHLPIIPGANPLASLV